MLQVRLPEEYEIRELNLALLWARAEGCEGGDYLVGLCQSAHDAQPGHGYCYGSDSFHHELLMLLVRDQVNAMRTEATGYDPSTGWDQEEVAAIIALENEGHA